MTDRYADLIAKLEAAPEGSRELDADIAEASGNPVLRSDHQTMRWIMWPSGDDTYTMELPLYTTSLDAALTLVPNTCNYELHWTVKRSYAEARIFKYTEDGHVAGENYSEWCDAKTPALALCIAALNARAAEEG